ncbi:DNA binding protein [Mycobacterium phage Kumao]|uniref:DNA binding protein n=1 Tax=Mycobacterium phage Kumao TaxID=2041344 RepID=A0A2D1GQ33_9CAUD|nr:DNA binding protein [Mycobacterium phage Kumao]ATN94043.1 DNA binding protein [Mycobacterium phage Kumao]
MADIAWEKRLGAVSIWHKRESDDYRKMRELLHGNGKQAQGHSPRRGGRPR